jgi:hypothetical protein
MNRIKNTLIALLALACLGTASAPAFAAKGKIDTRQAYKQTGWGDTVKVGFDKGAHTIRYRSLDAAGLVEAVKQTTVKSRLQTTTPGGVGGSVPDTLSLTLGAPASFDAFVAGADREYTAATTATVVSTAGDAALAVGDPGHLTNGAYALGEPLRVELSKTSWAAPVSNDPVTITFRQHIGATQPLRTGTYSRTVAFTLSTTTP